MVKPETLQGWVGVPKKAPLAGENDRPGQSLVSEL
jgi:hypothetical protein